MKFLILFLLFFSSTLLAENIFIRDSIDLRASYIKTYSSIFGDSAYALEEDFNQNFKSLPKTKKLKAKALIKKLDPILPAKFLRPLVHWKYISPDRENLKKVLLSIQINKLTILRDYINAPQSKEKAKALNLLRELIHEQEAEPYNFYSYSKSYLVDKANILAEIDDDDFFLKAMEETKLFSIKLNKNIPDIDLYTLSPYGLTNGNQIELIGQSRSFLEAPLESKLREMIKSSKESLLVDIFLLEEVIKKNSSKFLIDESLKKKDDFKLLILHSYSNPEEEGEVINYIKERINQDPQVKERVLLLKVNNYTEVKRSFSRLLIADGNSNQPEAYFSTTNPLDKNKDSFFDSAIWIKGPGAALIQNSYLEDINTLNKNNFEDSEEFLDSFKIKRDNYPSQGSSILNIAENSFDGKIRNIRNTLINQIKKAQSHIYMEQIFLYDSYIADALILKKKLEPSVSIKILLDNNKKLGFNGFPNSIFIQKMKDVGIEIRSRKTSAPKLSLNQENLSKISSFDSNAMLVGATNLTPESLQGSSRDLSTIVYNSSETKRFELEFEKSWDNRRKTQELNIEDFQFKSGDSYLSKLWSTFINDFAATFLRSKDRIERRY